MTLQHTRYSGRAWLFPALAVIVSCASYPVFREAPPRKAAHVSKKHAPPARTTACAMPRRDNLAPVNAGPWEPADSSASAQPHLDESAAPALATADSGIASISKLSVPRRFIRVALRQNARHADFYSAGAIDILSSGAQPRSVRGKFSCACSGEKMTCSAFGQPTVDYALPCTLHSSNAFNIIAFGQTEYRGSIVLAGEGRGSFSVINLCDVEDYLRGVVPLEIGSCAGQAPEALKAQAVAARTYTYKKIIERQKQAFDVLPTIADQVYGGVPAEMPQCNKAIYECKDLVAVYHDSLIYAYYHSTCGGKTADVEDVWDKPPLPYLRSIDDCDNGGTPFCRASPNFAWEESWSASTLSDIIDRFSRETFPQNPASGRLLGFTVESRFPCGRIKSCGIKTSSGEYRYGGDKIRFVLRRAEKGNPILRSAIITSFTWSGATVKAHGKGYGHGVGLCQFGAIGRALAGQSFEQIIKAYYTGVDIRGIVVENK